VKHKVEVSPAVAAKVTDSVERHGLTRQQALAIAKAEPRGATIFAGRLTPEPPSRRTKSAVKSNRKV